MRRRTFLGVAVAATLVDNKVTAEVPAVEVYKSPACGCCGKWAKHLRTNGFAVNIHDVADIDAFRAKAGVPAVGRVSYRARRQLRCGGARASRRYPASPDRTAEGVGPGGARNAGNLARHGRCARTRL